MQAPVEYVSLPEMPEEDQRSRECEEGCDRMTSIAEILERMGSPEMVEPFVSICSAFIKAQLARISPLQDIFRPWPSLPYVLMNDGEGLTHWVGDLAGVAARACDGERSQVAFARVKPGHIPTCLRCSVIASSRCSVETGVSSWV